ncbi:M14 family metallopeptidase [Ralstonia sp. UBA689]|uniref:M14 family metallopeptidase n=1 Tax=Ralstonia sp. UBA689 TaxID=1947373 RepID=UPI0025F74D47|nr:M14 family metallopeptidase [Ralstonia sp. UBA689]
MTVEPFFSQTYDEARGKFLAAAQTRGLNIEREIHPGAIGPSEEALSIDTALFSPAQAETLLIVTSGVHGVEGFCGSGCQIGLLHDDELFARLAAAKVALLLVHAVNPYGFAHLRRVNEDNVDLNRNSVDFAEAASANPAYLEVDPLLLPHIWPPSQADQAALQHYMVTRGEKALQDAATMGQYRVPDGMFYGGAETCWSTLQMRGLVSRHAAAVPRFVWIDLHTGLGHYGHGEKIFNSPDPSELERAIRTWGADVKPISAQGSVSSVVKGDLLGIAHELLPGIEKTCVTLEFGTLAPMAVLQALRADHWLHRYPERGAAQAAGIRKTLRDAFYCDTPEWKGMVYAQTRVAVLQAVARLSA